MRRVGWEPGERVRSVVEVVRAGAAGFAAGRSRHGSAADS